jgi:hypothetical protein
MRELFHRKTCGYLIQAVWSLRQSEGHIAACLKTAAISSRRSRTGPVRNCLMFRHDLGVPPFASTAKIAIKPIPFVEARLRRRHIAMHLKLRDMLARSLAYRPLKLAARCMERLVSPTKHAARVKG